MTKPDKPPGAGRNPSKPPMAGTKRRTILMIDPEAARRGESFAARQGSSLSQLVTNLLNALPMTDLHERSDATVFAPAVQRLPGVARESPGERATDHDAYREYLLDKYGTV